MKAETMTGTETVADSTSSRVRLSTLFLSAMIMVLLFSTVYIRQMSIKAGYDISSLMTEYEKSEIAYTALLEDRSESYDPQSLYQKAKRLGMTLPDVRRTFYVKD